MLRLPYWVVFIYKYSPNQVRAPWVKHAIYSKEGFLSYIIPGCLLMFSVVVFDITFSSYVVNFI